MNKKIFFVTGLCVLFLVTPTDVSAVVCNTGKQDTVITTSCSFEKTTDGVDNGNLTVGQNATLTIPSGQTMIWNPGKSITIQDGSSIVMIGTGKIQQQYLWCIDADVDGYCENPSSFIAQNTQPPNGRRLSAMLSLTITDCDDTYLNIENDCSWRGQTFYSINNISGSNISNYDALITLDTASLITAGDMQSDCDDIRIYDEGNNALNFWLESGCNTANTQIWFRVPTLLQSESYYTLLYNDTSATNASQAWSGTNVIGAYTGSCPSGWTSVSAINTGTKFIRGAATYGGTGGITSHTHTDTVTSTQATLAQNGCNQPSCGNAISTATSNHTHARTFTTDASSEYQPPYKDVIYCSYNTQAIPHDLTTAFLGFFETTPTGWTRNSTFDTLFPRGNSTAGGIGGLATHTHTFSTTLGGTVASTNSTTGVDVRPAPAHTHTIGGTTDTTSHVPPYRDLVFASPNAQTYNKTGIIGIFNSSTLPPFGWTRYTALDSAFPRGNTTSGGTGGSSSHTHTYTSNASSNYQNQNVSSTGESGITVAGKTHKHTLSGTSDSTGSVLPPYVDVVFAKRTVPSQTLTNIGSIPATGAYKKIVTITNAGGVQSNYDLNLIIDTATLVSQGKLQSDCDDLRFRDSGSNRLDYWLESGCNSSTTSVWVRLPTLNGSGNTLIDMYYGTPGASAGSLSWSGGFIVPRTAACPAGGTRVTAMDGYYVKGGNSYGSTGGSSTHNHLISGTTGESAYRGELDVFAGCSGAFRSDHTHTYSFSSVNANTLPPSINTILCSYSTMPLFQTTDVALVDTTPSGWTADSSFNSRFMVGSLTYGGTGGASTHTHTFSSTVNSTTPNNNSTGCGGSSSTINGGAHTHNTGSITTGATSSLPTYRDQIFIKPNANNTVLAQGGIVMLNTATLPPYGWQQYTSLTNLYPRGNTTAGGTGGANTHTHSYSFSTSGMPSYQTQYTNINVWGPIPQPPGVHDEQHSKTGTSGSGSTEPSNWSVIFGQKKTDTTTKSFGAETPT